MKNTIIAFDLARLADTEFVLDPNSFAMNGMIGWHYLDEFLWKETDWYAEVWDNKKNEILDSCAKHVIMEIWLDSDDYRSWIDFEVINELNINK